MVVKKDADAVAGDIVECCAQGDARAVGGDVLQAVSGKALNDALDRQAKAEANRKPCRRDGAQSVRQSKKMSERVDVNNQREGAHDIDREDLPHQPDQRGCGKE